MSVLCTFPFVNPRLTTVKANSVETGPTEDGAVTMVIQGPHREYHDSCEGARGVMVYS